MEPARGGVFGPNPFRAEPVGAVRARQYGRGHKETCVGLCDERERDGRYDPFPGPTASRPLGSRVTCTRRTPEGGGQKETKPSGRGATPEFGDVKVHPNIGPSLGTRLSRSIIAIRTVRLVSAVRAPVCVRRPKEKIVRHERKTVRREVRAGCSRCCRDRVDRKSAGERERSSAKCRFGGASRSIARSTCDGDDNDDDHLR